MKLGLITAALLLSVAACSKPVAPPPKAAEAPIQKASVEDCTHVYERVLSIVISEQLDQDQLFSKEAVQTAGEMLDQVYTQAGKKQHFFQKCTAQLNVQQTHCMTSAKSLEAMDVCAEFYKTKEQP